VLAFVLRRLLWTIPVLFVVVTAIFFLMRSIGGSPLRHGPLVGLTSAGGWQKYGDYQPEASAGPIEVLFSVPGISRYYVASVLARDYTVVLGITVLLALMIIVANLIVDIVQAYLDPRIREAPA
jgi:ABC-type dipeptide/oligopeptide/nickel transport system permease component